MALQFPIEAYLEAARRKPTLGQSIAEGLQSATAGIQQGLAVGEALGQRRKRRKLAESMKQQYPEYSALINEDTASELASEILKSGLSGKGQLPDFEVPLSAEGIPQWDQARIASEIANMAGTGGVTTGTPGVTAPPPTGLAGVQGMMEPVASASDQIPIVEKKKTIRVPFATGEKYTELFSKGEERKLRQQELEEGKRRQKEEREMLRQDRLEKIYTDRASKLFSARSGPLGLQANKVDQAIDLRSMINQNYNPKTGEYSIAPSFHTELVIGLARLLSPSGQIGIEMVEELKQKTAREGLAKTAIYLGADPKEVGGSTQEVVRYFVHSIDRLGTTSERLRDKYINDLKKLKPKDLDPDRADVVENTKFGSSFDELRDTSPDILQEKEGRVTAGTPYTSDDENRYQELMKKKQKGTLR